MKQIGILYSGEMVNALLAGRKSQTRRLRGLELINMAPDNWRTSGELRQDEKGRLGFLFDNVYTDQRIFVPTPYGITGDVHWAREAWSVEHADYDLSSNRKRIFVDGRYTADGSQFSITLTEEETQKFDVWKRQRGGQTPLFMFRSLSRIQRKVASIRTERLQEISEANAVAEGCAPVAYDVYLGMDPLSKGPYEIVRDPGEALPPDFDVFHKTEIRKSARESYADLWNRINGPKSWDINPHVLAVTYKREA